MVAFALDPTEWVPSAQLDSSVSSSSEMHSPRRAAVNCRKLKRVTNVSLQVLDFNS